MLVICKYTLRVLTVMPDWLRAKAPYQGDNVSLSLDDAPDLELQMEKDWLASSIRMFTEVDVEVGHKPENPYCYRSATGWLCVLLDTFLFIRTCGMAGLEAFSTKGTADAARRHSTTGADKVYLDQLYELCTSRFAFQRLGVCLDQWSVGVCAMYWLRYGLKLYVEPIYDGIHGIHRDIFRALDMG